MSTALEKLASEARWLLTAYDPAWVDEGRTGELQRWMQDAQGWAVATLRAFEEDEASDAPLLQAAREVFAATSSDAPQVARDALDAHLTRPASS